jgi:hypothetical protein
MEANLEQFVTRRLHPVRVTVSLINHELELAKGAKEVVVDRNLLTSVLNTLELFLEDYDAQLTREATRVPEKRFVEMPKTTTLKV